MPCTTLPNPGHAPEHIREAFLDSIEAVTPDLALAGQLWNCTDTLPRSACDNLGITLGSTYAQAARRLRQR